MSTLDRELTPGYDPRNHCLGKPRQGDVVEWESFNSDIIWMGTDGRLRRLRATTDVPRGTQTPATATT